LLRKTMVLHTLTY